MSPIPACRRSARTPRTSRAPLAAALLALAAGAATAQTPETPDLTAAPGPFTIGVQDSLRVVVWGSRS